LPTFVHARTSSSATAAVSAINAARAFPITISESVCACASSALVPLYRISSGSWARKL
jgi:hypothetical protein